MLSNDMRISRASSLLCVQSLLALPLTILLISAALAVEGKTGEVHQYNIPPGPVSKALTQFIETSRLFLAGTSALTAGVQSPGLSGSYTAEKGLRELLAGTGITYRIDGENTITLLAAGKPKKPDKLEMIMIGGKGETESGTRSPEGFRARNSVVATNADAPLIETPATVNVATRDFLDTIGARRIEEVLQYVPGASAESVNASGTGFNIRGFSTSVFGSVAGGGEASIQIDNYRSATRRYHFDPALYERIDVLKGSAALLYGTAGPGGVVRYVTRKPQFERLHRFEATLGSFETMRGTIDLSGPLGDDSKVAYRLIATGLNSNQSFHGDNDDISFDDRRIINPQLIWLTPGGGELYLNYEYSRHESTFDPGIKRLTDGSFTFNSRPFLGPDNFLERENHIGVAEFTQSLGANWQILVGGKIGRSNVDNFTDASFGLPNADNRLNRFTGRSDERMDHEEIRAQLSGQFNTGSLLQHQVTVGVYYLSEKNSTDRASVFQRGVVNALNPVFDPVPLGKSSFYASNSLEEQAVYIQDYLSVGKKLKVFGGLRYTDAEADVTLSSGRRPGSDTEINYTVGAIYNLQPVFNPFFSYASALTPQTGAQSGSGDAVPFRAGEQIELGLKSEWLGGRLATTASIFQVEQTNIAEGDPANRGFFILAGDQRTRGFEFEAVGEITDQISLLGGYSYLDAEFTEGGNAGATPRSVPRHKVSLFGQYEFSGDLIGWRASLGFIHVGQRQANNTNTFRLPTYERVDAFIGYQRGGLDFRLAIENVLDENYIIGSDAGSNLAQGTPRFFTLTADYEF